MKRVPPVLLLIVALLVSGCLSQRPPSKETAVQLIPLAPPLNRPSAQLSGLAWCQNKLVLLPQKPTQVMAPLRSDSHLYTLDKQQIVAAIRNQHELQAQPVRLEDESFMADFEGFDGYEAVVCRDDQFWLSIETKLGEQYSTTIVPAQGDLTNGVAINKSSAMIVKSGSGIWNFSDETLIDMGSELLSVHESNGTGKAPIATLVEKQSGQQRPIPIEPIPFRITDATALDEHNRFWVINYQFQNDENLANQSDWLAVLYPPGPTHQREVNVERLIELQVTKSGIVRTQTPPIYLTLTQERGRNWEGIARLDNLGLLLVTDEFPQTYFGFVPFADDHPK